MNQTNKSIRLSPASVAQTVALCDTIKRKSSTNEISISMATGIAAQVKEKGSLSLKQAKWVAQNAIYWKQKLPPELAALDMYDDVAKPLHRIESNVNDDAKVASSDTALAQVACTLKRIERLLQERLT